MTDMGIAVALESMGSLGPARGCCGYCVDQLRWDPQNSDVLSTASADKTVRIWDARTGKNVETIKTSGENINICWSPDSQAIAVGNKSDMVSVIDTRKFKILKTTKFPCEVNELSWNKKGDRFFLTTGLVQGMGQIEVNKCVNGSFTKIRSLVAHTANCYCIDFDPTNRYFATGGADALVAIWDVEHMICVRTIGRLDFGIRTLSFSWDGQFIAAASEENKIDIADVETGELVYSLMVDAPTNSVAWHPNKLLLAYAGDDGVDDRSRDDRDRYRDRHSEGVMHIFGMGSDGKPVAV